MGRRVSKVLAFLTPWTSEVMWDPMPGQPYTVAMINHSVSLMSVSSPAASCLSFLAVTRRTHLEILPWKCKVLCERHCLIAASTMTFPVVSVWDICIHVWLSGQKDPTMFWLSDGKVATHHQKAFYVFCFLVFACGVLIISFLFNNFVYEEPHTPALPLSRSSSSHNPFPNSWVLL